MDDFTFEDFVSVMGGSHTGDPAEVVEAWQQFRADMDDLESANEDFDYE